MTHFMVLPLITAAVMAPILLFFRGQVWCSARCHW